MYRKIMYEKYLSLVNVTEKELERNFSQNVDLQKEIVVNLSQNKKTY